MLIMQVRYVRSLVALPLVAFTTWRCC